MSARHRTPGDRLAQARRMLGVREWRDVKRSEIAEAAGIDPSTVTLYEKGGSGIGEDVLKKLCAFLGVTPQYVRYGVDQQPGDVRQGVGVVVAGRGAPAKKAPKKQA